MGARSHAKWGQHSRDLSGGYRLAGLPFRPGTGFQFGQRGGNGDARKQIAFIGGFEAILKNSANVGQQKRARLCLPAFRRLRPKEGRQCPPTACCPDRACMIRNREQRDGNVAFPVAHGLGDRGISRKDCPKISSPSCQLTGQIGEVRAASTLAKPLHRVARRLARHSYRDGPIGKGRWQAADASQRARCESGELHGLMLTVNFHNSDHIARSFKAAVQHAAQFSGLGEEAVPLHQSAK